MRGPSKTNSATTEGTDLNAGHRGHGSSLDRANRCPPFLSVSSVVALLVVARLVSLHAQGSSAAWPQFRGNPRLTGVAAAAPSDTLRLKWTYEAGDSIESSAAIVD